MIQSLQIVCFRSLPFRNYFSSLPHNLRFLDRSQSPACCTVCLQRILVSLWLDPSSVWKLCTQSPVRLVECASAWWHVGSIQSHTETQLTVRPTYLVAQFTWVEDWDRHVSARLNTAVRRYTIRSTPLRTWSLKMDQFDVFKYVLVLW